MTGSSLEEVRVGIGRQRSTVVHRGQSIDAESFSEFLRVAIFRSYKDIYLFSLGRRLMKNRERTMICLFWNVGPGLSTFTVVAGRRPASTYGHNNPGLNAPVPSHFTSVPSSLQFHASCQEIIQVWDSQSAAAESVVTTPMSLSS